MRTITQQTIAAALVLAMAFTFNACSSDDNGSDDNAEGEVPLSIIPAAVRAQFESLMPIYSGVTPPDISGQYLADYKILVGSSLSYDNVGSHYYHGSAWADSYVAFIKDTNGVLQYRDKNGSSQGEGDSVIVKVVGSNNNFTAYFVNNTKFSSEKEACKDIIVTSKSSTIISGTFTSDGISDFHNAFIILEKNDPCDEVMDINEYRIFKDGNGLAKKNNWLSLAKSLIVENGTQMEETKAITRR